MIDNEIMSVKMIRNYLPHSFILCMCVYVVWIEDELQALVDVVLTILVLRSVHGLG